MLHLLLKEMKIRKYILFAKRDAVQRGDYIVDVVDVKFKSGRRMLDS